MRGKGSVGPGAKPLIVEELINEDSLHFLDRISSSACLLQIGKEPGGVNNSFLSTRVFAVRHICPEGASPQVHLIYRPGHYDIFYLST